MASVRKYRNKYRAEIRRQGHAPMSKVFATKRAADKWARETETAIENGDLHNLSSKTVKELIQRYLDENEDLITYERNALQRWQELIGNIKLRDVRKAHIVTARNTLQKDKVKRGPNKGEPLSPATVNRRVALLARVCKIAIEEYDWLKENPANISSLEEDNERDRVLTPAEDKALFKALKAHSEPSLYGFCLVAKYSGMRASEIQRLRWEHIDMKTGAIQIRKSKNGQKRAPAVRGEALQWLKQWKQETGLKFKGYVFGNSNTKAAPYNYRAHWDDARKKAGLQDFRFHDFRHGFVTRALTAGMNPVLVQKFTGHSSAQMQARYAHLMHETAGDIAEEMAGVFEKK